MHAKKGIELSLNFIVVLIISLVVFGFGISFISNLSSKASDLQELTISELDDRIGDLICEGSERVCVGIDRKTIKKTSFDLFGIKIINILDSQNFDITVTRPTPSGYTRNKAEIQSDGLISNPPLNRGRTINIEKNEEKTIGIGIQVPGNAQPGTYIFNVEIKTSDGKLYSPIQKLYVDVPK